VGANGDLANWSTGAPDAIPAVGGAMDLAMGAKQVFVMMDLLTKKGDSKLVAQVSYPVTALNCVARVYTDHGVFNVGRTGITVVDMADGLTLDDLRQRTGLALELAASSSSGESRV
jgi:3-oxoadipate CoA-transferase beta subunit